MDRRRWFIQMIARSLVFRIGRTALLFSILAMASSLATALGIVSVSMEKRVAAEIRSYGANLVIVPEHARLDVGSGGLNFGTISEPVFLDQRQVEGALSRIPDQAERSMHLRGTLRWQHMDIPAEGVNFPEIRRLFPWWQLRGQWPTGGEAVIGSDLASRLGLTVGQTIQPSGPNRMQLLHISGVVTTGGDEDGCIFLNLPELQQLLEREGQISQTRLQVPPDSGKIRLTVAALQPQLNGALVREVRQVARTSEELLAKVKLLMLLVTAVVLVSAGSSVAGTMSTTVLERSKEIGLMKAMGGTRLGILLIFSGEALILGCLGGTAGYLVGVGIAQFITKSVFAASAEFLPGFIFVSLATALFLAAIGSAGPLLSVFRLDPVKSLRGE